MSKTIIDTSVKGQLSGNPMGELIANDNALRIVSHRQLSASVEQVWARRCFLTGFLAVVMAAEAATGVPGAKTASTPESKSGDKTMGSSTFTYISYIRATPETVWTTFFDPKMQSRAWMDHTLESDWRVDSAWRMISLDGRIANSGKVLEIDPHRRLVLSYRSDHVPEWHSEGYSRAVFELEPLGGATKFTVTHTIDRPDSKVIAAASASWPLVFSNLKSLIETGDVALTITASVLTQARSAK
jgi:uncharacterized protein YndB with AHSA1/START domain